MDQISIPVAFQLPPPLSEVILTLNPGQNVASKFAEKRLRNLLTSTFCDVDISGVTFTCNDGTPLPDMSATEYAAQHGTICARGSDLFLQQLQQQVSTLRAEVSDVKKTMANMKTEIDEMKLGRPQLLEDQRQFRKILRRDIVVRARNLLSHEGGQPANCNFYQFSIHLSASFLEERNLTVDTIALINGATIPAGDAIAHNSLPEELRRGLDGLAGDKLNNMTLLYNFVMQRQQ